MIFDSHVHVMPEGRTKSLVRWIKRAFPDHPSREEMTPEGIIADIRALGAGKAFNFVFPLSEEETEALNLFSRYIALEHPMLVPFGSMHVSTRDKAGVAEACLGELGLAGIKLHPYAQRFEAFSDEFEPLFKVLDRLGAPLFVHTGFDAFYGQTQDLVALRKTLEDHPGMPVVLVHSLFPRFELAHTLLTACPHVFIDITNVPGTLRLYDGYDGDISRIDPVYGDGSRQLAHLHAMLDEHSGRIMYGTDHPVGMGDPARIYRDLEWLGLSERALRDVTSNTASRFLEHHCGGAKGLIV